MTDPIETPEDEPTFPDPEDYEPPEPTYEDIWERSMLLRELRGW